MTKTTTKTPDADKNWGGIRPNAGRPKGTLRGRSEERKYSAVSLPKTVLKIVTEDAEKTHQNKSQKVLEIVKKYYKIK
jgi:hypothetical protein